VFHFLTGDAEREKYLATMAAALVPGGAVVMATFADDGPEFCSGLPVARYSPAQLADRLGERFTPHASRREVHTTPSGVAQPFAWVAGRLTDGAP
jgi:hypothetical protein